MRQRTMVALLAVVLAGWHGTATACGGDCNGDGGVAINELVLGVSIALGGAPGACGSLDANRDGTVTINELVAAVSSALEGCPDPDAPTRTPTPTRVPTAPPTATAAPASPRPTAAPGCTGGYFAADFADASADVNSHFGLSGPIELSDVDGTILTVGPTSPWNGFGGNAIACPVTLDRVIRRLAWTFNIMPAPLASGGVYPLSDALSFGEPVYWFDYVEQPPTNPFAIRVWRARAGTVTVDAIDGDTVTFHVDAEMVPNQNATGTFRLTARGTIDTVTRRN